MNAATPFPWPAEDSESGLGVLFEQAPVAIAQCGRHLTLAAANPAMEQMLGDDAKRPLHIGDLIHPEDRHETEKLLREMLAGERGSFQIEKRILSSNGSSVPVRWTAWRVPASAGKPVYGLIMAEPVTESRHFQRRLHEAEKLEAVGRLASGVAHDFNNLLTGVILYCDLMLGNLESGSRLRGYAEEIRTAGMQATSLVRQLLNVARPRNSDSQPLSLNQVAEGMRELLVRLIGENIELLFHLDPSLGLVKMETDQAQQILLNLVLNARDAMPDGGRITVETGNCRIQIVAGKGFGDTSPRALPCALFVVSDTGRGMDSETRQHLFEAFFTTKAADQGTGLGLATVHDIVTGSGGLIHADSEPGCGTRFTVLLPLVSETVEQPQRTANFQPQNNEGDSPQQEKEPTP
jgi:two-component system cell cycle sensor histidine kinase/response regulator CckA